MRPLCGGRAGWWSKAKVHHCGPPPGSPAAQSAKGWPMRRPPKRVMDAPGAIWKRAPTGQFRMIWARATKRPPPVSNFQPMKGYKGRRRKRPRDYITAGGHLSGSCPAQRWTQGTSRSPPFGALIASLPPQPTRRPSCFFFNFGGFSDHRGEPRKSSCACFDNEVTIPPQSQAPAKRGRQHRKRTRRWKADLLSDEKGNWPST